MAIAAIGYGRQSFTPSLTFTVGVGLGAAFPTIASALVAAEVVATNENRAIVYLSPGVYPENINIPDFVSIIGVGAGAFIVGSVTAGGIMVEVGQGCTFENTTIVPQLANHDIALLHRDPASFCSATDDYSAGINGTLVVDANGGGDETFTFTGEATVGAIVALINATAIRLFATSRLGKLLLLADGGSNGSVSMVIRATGTANAALGFSVIETTHTRSSESRLYMSTISIIGIGILSGLSGGFGYTHGFVNEDSAYVNTMINALSITGADGTDAGRGVVNRRGTIAASTMTLTGIQGTGSATAIELENYAEAGGGLTE